MPEMDERSCDKRRDGIKEFWIMVGKGGDEKKLGYEKKSCLQGKKGIESGKEISTVLDDFSPGEIKSVQSPWRR